MKVYKIDVNLVLLILILLTFQQLSQAHKTTSKLKGIVSNNSIDDTNCYLFHCGQIFDISILKDSKKHYSWIKIPSDMAGYWHRKYEIISHASSEAKYKSGEKILQETTCYFGEQKDRRNNIWECDYYPYMNTINEFNNTSSLDVFLCNYKITYNVKPKSFKVLFRGLNINVIKQNSKINSIEKIETDSLYKLIDYNHMQRFSKTTVFENNKVKYQVESLINYDRISKFKPINQLDNIDFKKSFVDFLIERKLIYLLPQ